MIKIDQKNYAPSFKGVAMIYAEQPIARGIRGIDAYAREASNNFS
jgi:hypothetical protein